ncbi:MAG TPA: hypothetical protein VLL25_15550 [Acidimicrobiales bacterium]|nr:hypothetical protein [Acidimicrobiales bacterium]
MAEPRWLAGVAAFLAATGVAFFTDGCAFLADADAVLAGAAFFAAVGAFFFTDGIGFLFADAADVSDGFCVLGMV